MGLGILHLVTKKNVISSNTLLLITTYHYAPLLRIPELRRLLFERMNRYVIRKNDQYIASKSPPQYGILIEDTEGPNKDAGLRNKVGDMLFNGTMYDHIDYLIEDPLFTDSKWRNLSQIVDCVAYCVRRNYMTNQNPIKKATWKGYFNQIYNKFDKPNAGTTSIGSGIKILP